MKRTSILTLTALAAFAYTAAAQPSGAGPAEEPLQEQEQLQERDQLQEQEQLQEQDQAGPAAAGRAAYVDADGDGICDSFQARGRSGQRQGAGKGRRGRGPGDGTGNQGVGPRDGSGHGAGGQSGNCDGTGPKGTGRRGGR